MQGIILKIRNWRDDYQKAFKKSTFFFWTQSLLMDKVIKTKMGLELVTRCSSGYKTSSEKFLYLLYYLTKFDDLIWSNFWVIAKVASANLCKSIYGIIYYSTSICPVESGNCGKEGKKLQKTEYLKNKKSFLDEIKNIFHSFWRAIIWWKNKNLIKNSGHKL